MASGWEDAPEGKAHTWMDPRVQSLSHAWVEWSVGWRSRGHGAGGCSRSVPAIVLDHVCQLDDVFAFFIFLAAFKGMFLRDTRKKKDAE